MPEPLQLSDQVPFARGGNRACYVHPEDAHLCVKVALSGKTAAEKRRAAGFFKRLRPLVYYDDNRREWATYERLSRRAEERTWEHLAKPWALVATDCGPAVATELIRDFDGQISSDLKAILRAGGRTASFQAALDDLEDYLRRTGLPTRDLLLHNLVGQKLDPAGRLRMVIIDGFGNSDFLPLAYWSRRWARLKVERKIAKFRLKIDEFCHKYAIPTAP
jgi:hypothetical protein